MKHLLLLLREFFVCIHDKDLKFFEASQPLKRATSVNPKTSFLITERNAVNFFLDESIILKNSYLLVLN
jgi:hypothetical protein